MYQYIDDKDDCGHVIGHIAFVSVSEVSRLISQLEKLRNSSRPEYYSEFADLLENLRDLEKDFNLEKDFKST